MPRRQDHPSASWPQTNRDGDANFSSSCNYHGEISYSNSAVGVHPEVTPYNAEPFVQRPRCPPADGWSSPPRQAQSPWESSNAAPHQFPVRGAVAGRSWSWDAPEQAITQLSRTVERPFMDSGQEFQRHASAVAGKIPYQAIGDDGSYRSMGPPTRSNLRQDHQDLSSDQRRSSGQSIEDYRLISRRLPPTHSLCSTEYPGFLDHLDEIGPTKTDDISYAQRISGKPHRSQKRANRDEFDGPTQFLKKPPTEMIAAHERDLPHVPVSLDMQEQDGILFQVNQRLSQCAFDFVAKYQFPIPLEADKRPVKQPEDREWTEWVYLLKRLATKRRIPARILYNGQIKQLVTILENSLEMRHVAAHNSRPPRDDRNVLQLISAGTQVAKILKDGNTMGFLDSLYQETEMLIRKRRNSATGCIR